MPEATSDGLAIQIALSMNINLPQNAFSIVLQLQCFLEIGVFECNLLIFSFLCLKTKNRDGACAQKLQTKRQPNYAHSKTLFSSPLCRYFLSHVSCEKISSCLFEQF